MKKLYTFKSEAVPLFLVLLSVLSSGYFYQNFPQSVPTHWNFAGEVDGYSSKGFAAFFFPALTLGIYALMLILPALDPRKEKYAEFAKTYHIFKAIIVGVLTVIYFIVGIAGTGYPLNVSVIMPLLIGAMFVVMGNYMPKIKSNWFIGIRTPWTLSNDEVWMKTHRLGGKLFIILGLCMFIIAWLQKPTVSIILFGGVIIAAIVPMVYSFILFKRLQK